MTKTQKILSALFTILLGVMLIILQGEIISIAVTVLGIAFITLGVLELFQKNFPRSVIQLVVGCIVIIFAWTLVGAVLYLLAGLLLIIGILTVYEKWRRRGFCGVWYHAFIDYAVPILCIAIGIILLFNKGNTASWVFVVSGSITIVEGGFLLADALQTEN